jgi:hypothetical protein
MTSENPPPADDQQGRNESFDEFLRGLYVPPGNAAVLQLTAQTCDNVHGLHLLEEMMQGR